MSDIVHISYYRNCCNLDKVLCFIRFVLLSFERCRDFGCRFFPDREVSFQVAATDKLVITTHLISNLNFTDL